MEIKLSDHERAYSICSLIGATGSLAIGLTLCFVETRIVSCLIGTCLIIQGGLEFALHKKHQSRYYSISQDVFSMVTAGNVIAAFLSLSSLYTNGRTLRSIATPFVLLLVAVRSEVVRKWRLYINEKNSPTAEVSFDSEAQKDTGHRVHRYFILLCATLIFGIALSRIPNGMVPISFFSEGVVGVLFSAEVFSQIYPRWRRATRTRAALSSAVPWSLIWIILSGVFYGLKATTRELHYQYGITLLISFSYFLITLLALLANLWFFGKCTLSKNGNGTEHLNRPLTEPNKPRSDIRSFETDATQIETV